MAATRDTTQRRRAGGGEASGIADVIGGRLLAWAGGLAVAIGLVLLAAMASASHRFGVPERLGLAGGGSVALLGVAVWLHERRARTEASIVAAGAALLGMFVTLGFASRGYGYVSPTVALLASLAVGLLAAELAARWAGQAIGWLGLLGAVLSPLAVRAPIDGLTLALLAVALGCLLTAAVRRRWRWLALAGVLAAFGQWGWWLVFSHSLGAELLVLTGFPALGLAAAIAERRRAGADEDARSTPAGLLLVVNVVLAGALGRFALGLHDEATAGDLWLAGAGAVHLTLGSLRRLGLGVQLRTLLLGLGVVLLDVAFGLSAHGLLLTAGWSGAVVGFAALRRRALAGAEPGPSAIDLGLAAHVAVVLLRVGLTVPPDRLGGGDGGLSEVLATASLAAACVTSAWLAGPGRRAVADGLSILGLAAIAYLTAQTLHGPLLVGAWALQGAGLAELARRAAEDRRRADWIHGIAASFLALALGHVLIVEAPPSSLLDGAPAIGAAALAIAVLSAGVLRAGFAAPRLGAWRSCLLAAGAVTTLYLASVAIVSLYGPALDALGAFGGAVIDLSVRQQGQVVLSICWGLIGLGGVIVGLRRAQPLVRNVALGLLCVAVTKVFAYDLSALTSVYRVMSLLGFGLLLLCSAFAYQRLRPESGHASTDRDRDAWVR